MQGFEFSNGSQTLNGRIFLPWEYAQSFREQDGYAIVLGKKLHYWLYDTYTYHNGDSGDLLTSIIPQWAEKMGYVIDYDNIRIVSPNPDLASSVKTLMRLRGCDISVALVTSEQGFSNFDYVVINNYDKDKGTYSSVILPLYR